MKNFEIVDDPKITKSLCDLFSQDVPPTPPDWGALMRAAPGQGKQPIDIEITPAGLAVLAYGSGAGRVRL